MAQSKDELRAKRKVYDRERRAKIKNDPTLLEAHRLKVARARAKKKAWINNLKLERGCELCGYRKCAAALEFHHLDPASKELHIGLRYNCSNARLKAEIDKCMVVCANCHRELHYGHV